MSQIKLHKKIDKFIDQGVDSADFNILKEELLISVDSKNYFFSKLDHTWVESLLDNRLLESIKTKKEDPTKYGYQTPEINYLNRVVDDNSEVVTNIILEGGTATTEENFNPEVVNGFLRIAGDLPADQLGRVIPKIEKQNWVKLVGPLGHVGSEFKKMFGTLFEAEKYTDLLKLSEIVLNTKNESEVGEDEFKLTSRNPFYINDLSYTKVFEFILKVDFEDFEEALRITTNTLGKIVKTGDKYENQEGFEYKDIFSLFDVDFFDLHVGNHRRISSRDDVKELFGVVKELADRTIGREGVDQESSRKLFNDYFEQLPDSPSIFRLKLYVLSINPNYFIEELKISFSRFEVEENQSYVDVVRGAEYESALKKSFTYLDEAYKKEYVEKVIKFFSDRYEKSLKEKKQKWHLGYGSDILSSIYYYFEDNKDTEIICLRNEAESLGFTINPDHKPEPTIMSSRSGSVKSKGPVDGENLGKLEIKEIILKIKNEWSPGELNKKNKSEDFLNPTNADGLGSLIKEDVGKRLQDYIDKAPEFFDIDEIDSHYVYDLLRGFEEVFKDNKDNLNTYRLNNLFELFNKFIDSDDKRLFGKREKVEGFYDSWLSNWINVHSAMCDVVQSLVDGKSSLNFSEYRERLLKTIGYLLEYPDPTIEDEAPETASSKTSNHSSGEMVISDPFSMAINGVRGRAFQALVIFIYKDGSKLAEDVKSIYTKTLDKENTRAIMFMFGYYIPPFYSRDKDFVFEQLSKIFPESDDKKQLYLASWQGFVSNSIYKDLFEEKKIQELYKKNINVDDPEKDIRQQYKDPNEAVAIHMALAYMFFDYDGDLYKLFWSDATTIKQKGEFVKLLGSMFVSGDNHDANKLLKDQKAKDRLANMWDFILKEHNKKEILSEMGMWFSLEKGIFDPVWLAGHIGQVMIEIDGEIEWEYGLSKNIVELAKHSPKDVINIAQYFFIGKEGLNMTRRLMYLEQEWFDAIKIIFENGDKKLKDSVYDLIDNLIEYGKSTFWTLKEIVNDYERD